MLKKSIYLAAVAGLAAATPTLAHGAGDVKKEKCWGINKCKDFGKCGVAKSDVEATKEAFGDKFAKSKLHDCAGDGNCAAAKGELAWTEVPAGTCISKEHGFMIVKEGDKKVLKK
jgi:hypothetical protein